MGRCKKYCPQKCIKSGKPYEIKQNNCLHCGLCFETCPVNAIKRRSS
ncbi:4Fe-4S binding protein [Clostridium sp.]